MQIDREQDDHHCDDQCESGVQQICEIPATTRRNIIDAHFMLAGGGGVRHYDMLHTYG